MAKNKKKTLWIILVLVLLLGGGGGAYAYYNHMTQPVQSATEDAGVQTAIARQGDLSIYASGAGTVIASSERGAGFDESGTLIELLVAVGDVVDEGQVLARLQTDHTAESIALEIANAELSLLQAQKTLDDLVNADISLQIAQSQVAVLEAQTALERTAYAWITRAAQKAPWTITNPNITPC
jgi:multidrug efflux pump subunit AcrA (membrane-fusion protein)